MLKKIFIIILMQGIFLNMALAQNTDSTSYAEVEKISKRIVELINQSDSLIKNNILSEQELLQKVYNIVDASPKEISKFKSELNNVYANIINRVPTVDERQSELNKLKINRISAIPELYQLVHHDLQALLNGWKLNKAQQYVVSPGDNLWKIAEKIDSTLSWKRIYDFNKDRIKNPDQIYPQQTLMLPYYKFFVDTSYSDIRKTDKYFPEDSLESKNITKRKNEEIEIEGLIVDATQTKVGHDFYDMFYSNWQPPANFSDFTITINEKPYPRQGSFISISVNDTEIFQRFLQPRIEIIEEMAQQGVYVTINFLENYEQIQQELQGDDLRGSGIY